ncbi:MAG: hypothetical protein HY317_01305 [Acidobacteria bacterium]|nr:hypothetical protein [Acidobacteriota bacterium]
MRPMAALLVAARMALAPPATAESPLEVLAARLAEQIAALAAGQPVELSVPEDRTGRGSALVLDLRALVAARLAGRVVLATEGPRLRVASVVSESPRQLVLSARVVEEPGGRLVDLVSVSASADATLLGLAAVSGPAGREVEVVSAVRTPPLEGPILHLAFVSQDRLAVLLPEAVALFRWEHSGLALDARLALTGLFTTVRSPAGVLLWVPGEEALWALTNRSPKAVLLGIQGDRVSRRGDGAALPWPGCPGGLRYRPGTNLLEGTLAGLGAGPFLAVGSDGDVAVSPEGTLQAVDAPPRRRDLVGEPTAPETRVGPTLAPLWGGLLAASSPAPPGSEDAILVYSRAGGRLALLESLPASGSVRALTAYVEGGTARLAAAVEETDGLTRLLLLDLRRREP